MVENTSIAAGINRDPTDEPIITIRDADVQFQMDKGTSHVLKGVNLDIYRGETLGVVGESGSGKSMFADALLDAVVDPGILTGRLRTIRKTATQSTYWVSSPGN